MKGPHGAPCSGELKRTPLRTQSLPEDVNVLGFTREESDRFDEIQDNFPDVAWRAPLIERNLSKDDCLTMIERAGVAVWAGVAFEPLGTVVMEIHLPKPMFSTV
jgi:hypothetical protein